MGCSMKARDRVVFFRATALLMVLGGLSLGGVESCSPQQREADDAPGATAERLSPVDRVPDLTSSLSLLSSGVTSADMAHVVLEGHEAGVITRQAHRLVGQRVFYVVEDAENDRPTRYRLGVLEPGQYAFVVLEPTDVANCDYRTVGQLDIVVQGPEEQSDHTGSGRLGLLMPRASREALQEILIAERPQVSMAFGAWGYVETVPGLEVDYRRLLASLPVVQSVEFDLLASRVDCPPPLGPAYQPSRLVVQLREEPDELAVASLEAQLPPLLEYWVPALHDPSEIALAERAWTAVVRVLPGREHYFLERFLSYAEVLDGDVLPSCDGGS